MYPFNKRQNEDGSWCLELGGIKLVLEGYFVENEKHWLKNPKRAIAFFSINGNLYGISNQAYTWSTAEDLYDNMHSQLLFFQKDAFPRNFFLLYGFKLVNNEWQYRTTDEKGQEKIFSYSGTDGWTCNFTPLTQQPEHIGAFLELFNRMTGKKLDLAEDTYAA